jgi:surfactin synthase thioesterase subunit/acyl carrier protein
MRIEEKNAKLESDSAKILAIISEESGIDSADLLDDMQLVDLGIDSLLSLLITSRLRDDLQFDLGPITSLFDEFKTLKQLKMAYAQSQGLTIDEEVPLSSEAKDAYQMETRESETVINSLSANKDNISQSVLGGDNHYGLGVGIARPITSIVLQQCSSPDSKILFLFPDGSGSATSYTRLPPVSDHITIIALTCPYRRDPHNMTCSLECLISSYISEIKRRQPTGAYALGGWSSGGIFAFCAAQMLLDAGETVQDLLLLDSPALQIGRGLDRLPKRFFEHCQQVGVFGQVGATDCNGRNGSQSPDWLIPHFEATIELLAGYRAQPLKLPKGAVVPRISLCWASECALDGSKYATFKINDEDDEGVRFLAEKRTDYGAGSWATMFPGLHCHVEVLQGWNHFNMMVSTLPEYFLNLR